MLLSYILGLWLYIDIIGTLITIYILKNTNLEEKYPKLKKKYLNISIEKVIFF